MIEKHHNRQRRNAKRVGTAWQTIRRFAKGGVVSSPEHPRALTLRDHRQEGLRLRDQFHLPVVAWMRRTEPPRT